MMLPLVALFAVAGFHQQFNSAGFKATVQRYAETKSLDDLAEAIRKDNKLPGLCIAYQKGSDKTESAVVGLRNMQNTSSPIEDDDRLPIRFRHRAVPDRRRARDRITALEVPHRLLEPGDALAHDEAEVSLARRGRDRERQVSRDP